MTAQLLDRPESLSEAEWAEIVDAITRREFLTGSAALGLGLAVRCSSDTARASTAKGWTFTDDLGHTVHVAHRPGRIAALGDQLATDLWAAGVHVVLGIGDLEQPPPQNRSGRLGCLPGYSAHLHGSESDRHNLTLNENESQYGLV